MNPPLSRRRREPYSPILMNDHGIMKSERRGAARPDTCSARVIAELTRGSFECAGVVIFGIVYLHVLNAAKYTAKLRYKH
jgi:hypothetical protein